MHYALVQRPLDQMTDAPVVVEREIRLDAGPDEVFEVLADHSSWPRWFKGMRRTEVDGAAEGAGALRTVWLGPIRVQEQFVTWHPGQRLTFDIVVSNVPGLLAMKEDWTLREDGPGRSVLTIRASAEPSGPARAVPGLMRWVLRRAMRGATGLQGMFSGGARRPERGAAPSAPAAGPLEDLVGVGAPATR